MAFCELKYFSPSLQRHLAADIIVPEGKKGPYPVLYLLHGLSDDHTIWQRRTSIERYVSGYPLIVVMPDTGRGWYTDAIEGQAYETSITGDLINFVDTTFRTKARANGRCLAGLSMGGYGAVKLALKRPDLFQAAASHSGALGIGTATFKPEDAKDENERRWLTEMSRIFGANPADTDNDILFLAKKADIQQRPALYIDCGTDDFFLHSNQWFHEQLQLLDYSHEYIERPGAHNWEYWDLHIQESLRFVLPHVGIKIDT